LQASKSDTSVIFIAQERHKNNAAGSDQPKRVFKNALAFKWGLEAKDVFRKCCRMPRPVGGELHLGVFFEIVVPA